MSEIVPSPPDSGRITLRRVSRSPATTTVLLIATVAFAVLWRTTDDSRTQLQSDWNEERLTLESERDAAQSSLRTLIETTGELKSSLDAVQVERDVAISDRDAKGRELVEVREDLIELGNEKAVSDELLNEREKRLIKLEAQLESANVALADARTERDSANSKRDATLADLTERDRQLAEIQAQLDSTSAELVEARNKRDEALSSLAEALDDSENGDLLSERDDARADLAERDNELTGAQGQLESVNTELAEALAQQSRAHSVLTLEGLLQERSFPKASFYRANGTIKLDSGAWVFIPGDIGGAEATRAGEASVTYTVIPSSCIRELEGDWPGTLVLDCPATVEWTVESRYPHFLLNILPIENFVMQDNVEQSTQGE